MTLMTALLKLRQHEARHQQQPEPPREPQPLTDEQVKAVDEQMEAA